MAGRVERSQALLYARDLKALYGAARARENDLAQAYRRLQSAYRQSLRYARDLNTLHTGLQRAIFQSLLGLANALEAKDFYTRGHSERVSRLARRLALARGFSLPSAHVVAQAGLLHDLGKIGVPESVLTKPRSLTEAERQLMQQHPVIGAQIVAPLDFFAAGALIIRHHHERMDGSGYPDRLAGEAIPLGARIVGAADVYDALTSDRPYRQRLPHTEAVRVLEAAAGHTLDATLVLTLCALLLDGSPKPAF
ncbi:MAG: HD-GYP domain-containing protein [Candidatus Methylomirabilia bacterium]